MTSEKQKPKRRGAPPEYLFKKGQSGNPKGRPKLGTSLAELLRLKGEEEGANEKIAEAVVKKAMDGDTVAAKLFWDRGYGQAPQVMDVTQTLISHTIDSWQEYAVAWFKQHAPGKLASFVKHMDDHKPKS